MTLVEELQEQGITLEAVGDRLKFRGPAHLLTPALRQRLATHKVEVLAHLRRQQPAGTLEERARYARSEGELDTIVMEIQAHFAQGQLTQVEAECLAQIVVDTARQLGRGLVNIPAAAFLEAI
ncbi:MAG: hypothetical protein HYW07_01660 [Candidatus Latescibacteria bacterium]|nr:hypothetical protein [Candidatus Latescibacterota bacterium]